MGDLERSLMSESRAEVSPTDLLSCTMTPDIMLDV